MLDDKLKDLIERDVDGLTSADESDFLRTRLETNREASSYYESLTAVSRVLKRARMVDPPPGIREGVLRSIRTLLVTGRRGRLETAAANLGAGIRAFFGTPRSVLLGAAAAAALGLVIFGVREIPIVRDGAQGTIGIGTEPLYPSASDPAGLRKWLDSDLVRQLTGDRAFQKAALQPGFDRVLGDVDLRAQLEIEALQAALKDGDFRRALEQENFRVALVRAAIDRGRTAGATD